MGKKVTKKVIKKKAQKGKFVPKIEIIEKQIKAYGLVTNGHLLKDFPNGVPRTRRKVAIVGFAPSSMLDVSVLFEDKDFEIWGINQLYLAYKSVVPHTTRWFQIHHRESYDQAVRDHKHHDWLKEQTKFPIYMQRQEETVPMSIPYPKDEIVEHFGLYFTNSISWMLALAIYEGFEAIHIYGVDMAQDDEYREQRPSVEWLIGWAQALLGREKVYIPAQSDLMKTAWLYPFEEDSPIRAKIESRRNELINRRNQLQGQLNNMHAELMNINGAAENMNYVEKAWLSSVREQKPGQVIINR